MPYFGLGDINGSSSLLAFCHFLVQFTIPLKSFVPITKLVSKCPPPLPSFYSSSSPFIFPKIQKRQPGKGAFEGGGANRFALQKICHPLRKSKKYGVAQSQFHRPFLSSLK
jgi:hypothetical protein